MTPHDDPGIITREDLVVLLLLGWAEPVGRTPDGKVTSYALTPKGRAILRNHVERDYDDSVPECML